MEFIDSHISVLGASQNNQLQTKYSVIEFGNNRLYKNVLCHQGLNNFIFLDNEDQGYWITPVMFGLLHRIVAVRRNGKMYIDARWSGRLETFFIAVVALLMLSVIGWGMIHVVLPLIILVWYFSTRQQRAFKKFKKEHPEAAVV